MAAILETGTLSPSKRLWALVALLALLQFLVGLGRSDVTGPFEGRVAATARGMIDSGDWVVPRLNGELRLQKPPLPYWLAASLWSLTGSFDAFWLRLPPALMGGAATALVAWLARRQGGRAAGFLAAVAWVSCQFAVDEFRQSTADPYLAFFVLATVCAYLKLHDELARAPSAKRSILCFTAAFWLSLALGALSKGPVALAHVVIALGTFHAVETSRPRWTWAHAPGFILFLAIALPWPLCIVHRVEGVMALWSRESLGQIVSERNPRPFWYYLPQPLYLTIPWSLPFCLSLYFAWKSPRELRRRIAWPLVWFGLATLLFSFSRMKKNAYLLPLLPALILLIAVGLEELTSSRGLVPERLCLWIMRLHWSGAFGYLIACMGYAAFISAASPDGVGLLTISAATASLAAAGAAWWRFRSGRRSRGLEVVAAAFVFALGVHWKAAWVKPLTANLDSPRAFGVEARRLAQGAQLYAWGGVSESLLFYTGGLVPLVRTEAELAKRGHGFLIARQRDVPVELRGKPARLTEAEGSHPPGQRLVLLELESATLR